MASGAYTHAYTHTRIHSQTKVIIRNQARRPVAGAPGLKMELRWYTGEVENGDIAFTTHRIWVNRLAIRLQ